MTRRRRHYGNPTSKRPTKWCRQHFTDLVQDETNLVIGDGLSLCPITTAIDSQADITCDALRITGSVARATATDIHLALMWIVALQKFDVSTGNMLQVVNPFDELDLSSQDIMGFGFLNVPPVLLIPSTDVTEVNREAKAFDIVVRAKRKLKRNTHSVVLTLASQGNAGTDNHIEVKLATSLLMKWGKS